MNRTHVRIALVAILAMLIAPRESRGQNAATPPRMSLSAGVAQSRFVGSDAELYGLDNPVMGLYVGLATDLPILGQRTFRFGPGARYISRGYEVDVDQSKTHLKYVELIAPLIVEVPLAGPLSFSVSGGPGIALSMGCTIRTESEGVQRSIDCQNSDLFYRGYDFTAFGSAGFAFGLPNGTRVLLNAGLDRSLTSIDSTGEGIDFKNQSLLFGAQATFPVGSRRR